MQKKKGWNVFQGRGVTVRMLVAHKNLSVPFTDEGSGYAKSGGYCLITSRGNLFLGNYQNKGNREEAKQTSRSRTVQGTKIRRQ